MPLGILDLPEEIIDPIVGALLPEYDPNGPRLNTYAYEHLVDLLCCRLVCWSLFRPASRWLCRRVHLKLCRFNQHVRVTATPFTRPEYASNTRVLHISGRTGSDSHQVQPRLSLAGTPLFSGMRNLRILVIQLCPTLVTEILPQLLSLPLLHTVVLEGSETTVDSINWSCIGGPFPNIKKLDFRRIRDIGPLISLAPSLEALSLNPSTRLDDVLSSIPFPWYTLRQLALERVLDIEKTCVALLESYQYLRDNVGVCASLTELMVTQNLTITDARRLLSTFGGQPLQSLIIGCVVNLDIQFLESVVATFPKLHEFALLRISAESDLSTITELDHYATVLGQLRELQVLHLNWIRHHDDDHLRFRILLDSILIPIVFHCRKLTQIRFMHQGDGISTIANITRDNRGQYKGHVFETLKDRCCLATSAWHVDRYPVM
ncbi:hypothetical protein JB92DRAFT_3138899 [Gautieria morchelliformis]|nr:hypothetical protein JB92DRAFT_3138899 [Gautieria morchelliformis]